jgi:hypothetical protein
MVVARLAVCVLRFAQGRPRDALRTTVYDQCEREESNLHVQRTPGPKPGASANSATLAALRPLGAPGGRTPFYHAAAAPSIEIQPVATASTPECPVVA